MWIDLGSASGFGLMLYNGAVIFPQSDTDELVKKL